MHMTFALAHMFLSKYLYTGDAVMKTITAHASKAKEKEEDEQANLAFEEGAASVVGLV
jgi:hypothetical protein